MEEKTGFIPPINEDEEPSAQHEASMAMDSINNSHPPTHGKPKNRQDHIPWKPIVAAIIAFILGAWITSCGSIKPTDSQDYKDLDAKYSKVSKDLKSTKSELSDTKAQLKTAKNKADQWDKEQADKKAADEKKTQEQAAQAAQAAQQAQQQAEQQAQAQQQAEQEARAQQQQAQAQTMSQGGPTAHRGAFCSGEGSTGSSDQNGATLTCRVARDNRLRWMN